MGIQLESSGTAARRAAGGAEGAAGASAATARVELDGLRAALTEEGTCALLESGPGFGALGRYSILAASPRAVFEAIGNRWELSPDWPGERPARGARTLDALRQLLRQTAEKKGGAEGKGAGEQAPIFAGGWIGFLGYDVAPLLEELPRRFEREGSVPDLHLAYYDTFALIDHATGETRLAATDRFDEGERGQRERLERLIELASGENARPEVETGPLVSREPQSQFSPDEYCWTVGRILEYIRAGDIFQANLAQRFSAPFVGTEGELYRRCRMLSPAPFGGFIKHAGWSIVSTSPERFFKLTPDRWVETRPIKGTRPRGRDTIHDLLLRCDLGDSAKDLAELTMIVDLERNDLGRVCRYGSIAVAGHAAVESYSNVHHLVSTVRGRLREDADVVDLLAAMFPGGSITGAPKIRAMQIVDELERCRRGVYTGAIGYLSDNGHADFNIAIRTVVVDGGQVHYHVGGGIVADSDPLAEYRETLAKGQRLKEILAGEGEP